MGNLDSFDKFKWCITAISSDQKNDLIAQASKIIANLHQDTSSPMPRYADYRNNNPKGSSAFGDITHQLLDNFVGAVARSADRPWRC